MSIRSANKLNDFSVQTPYYWTPNSMLLDTNLHAIEKQQKGIIEEVFSVCVKVDGGEATFAENRIN